MRPKNFIPMVQRKVAVSSIGPSSLRGQGKGVLKASQEFLAVLPLDRVPKSSEARFQSWLDRQTESLLDKFQIRKRPWGAARKAINLFLRDSLYNQYLSRWFVIDKIESWLEIPLDRVVAHQLRIEAGKGGLPPWTGLKHLREKESEKFQQFALSYARKLQVERVHLDIYLWLDNR